MEHPRVRALKAEAKKSTDADLTPAEIKERNEMDLLERDSAAVMLALGRRDHVLIDTEGLGVSESSTWLDRLAHLDKRHPGLSLVLVYRAGSLLLSVQRL